MTNLKDFPPELMDKILFHCSLPVLLQLRLVSSRFRTRVDSSSCFTEALEDIQINLHSSTLAAFVESAALGLPFSNFLLNNQSEGDDTQLYRTSRHLRTFKDVFCPRIHKLRVRYFFCCSSESELDLFKCLPNLKELYIGEMKLQTPKSPEEDGEKSSGEVGGQRLPWSGVNWGLKRLLVSQEDNCGGYLIQWIQSCPSLEVIQLPWSIRNPIGAFEDGESTGYRESTPWIWRLGAQGALPSLKTLVMSNQRIRMELCSAEDLRFFQEMMADEKVRLERVQPEFLRKVRQVLPHETLGHLKQRIGHFHGPTSEELKEGFLNLQTLEIRTFPNPEEDCVWDDALSSTQALPALRKIDCVTVRPPSTSQKVHEDFLQWIFRPGGHQPWKGVTELNVDLFFLDLRFGPEHVDLSFPNLTKLTLKLEDSRDVEGFVEVISRKKLLQELILHLCQGIPESALVAEDPEGTDCPVLLRLKNLSKLRLSWIGRGGEEEWIGDGMVGLLSRMSLTHLTIRGREVGNEGLERLVEGPFGQSVLWIRVNERKETGKYPVSPEMLERVAHGNRVAMGLTSTTFEQFQTSQEVLTGGDYPFKVDGWRFHF